MELLQKFGADYVINYIETPNWGEEAKKITGGLGVDHVIEVGGSGTLQQSLEAIKIEGVISLIGFMVDNKSNDEPKLLQALYHACIVRGVLTGNKAQFQEMNDFIDRHNIRPIVDQKTFDFKEVKEAYRYLQGQKHFGKVTIKI